MSELLKLLPYPQSLVRQSGTYILPKNPVLYLEPSLPRDTVLLPVAQRLQTGAFVAGADLELVTGPKDHPRLAIQARQGGLSPSRLSAYALSITPRRISLDYQDVEGLHAGVSTLRQLFREYGKRLPCLRIRDYPDFAKRGVMLDISRGRVPNLCTLKDLASHLADFKINELQLYTEHTFAYRNYEPVWRGWGPLTGQEMMELDAALPPTRHRARPEPKFVWPPPLLARVSTAEEARGNRPALARPGRRVSALPRHTHAE